MLMSYVVGSEDLRGDRGSVRLTMERLGKALLLLEFKIRENNRL